MLNMSIPFYSEIQITYLLLKQIYQKVLIFYKNIHFVEIKLIEVFNV